MNGTKQSLLAIKGEHNW